MLFPGARPAYTWLGLDLPSTFAASVPGVDG
jgi:hypothetical protein